MEKISKYIVVWDNPRRVELCEIVKKEKELIHLISKSTGVKYLRHHKMVFDSEKAIEKFLEIEDYRSIH